MSADTLLSRLEGVRANGDGRWLAKCPSHDDKRPSLSIRETSDGTVLVKCWAGCGALDVLDAVGLEWSALFPPRASVRVEGRTAERRPFDAVEAMHALAHEALTVAVIAHGLARLGTDDADRLALAVRRIHAALGAIGEPRRMPTELRAAASGEWSTATVATCEAQSAAAAERRSA